MYQTTCIENYALYDCRKKIKLGVVESDRKIELSESPSRNRLIARSDPGKQIS